MFERLKQEIKPLKRKLNVHILSHLIMGQCLKYQNRIHRVIDQKIVLYANCVCYKHAIAL